MKAVIMNKLIKGLSVTVLFAGVFIGQAQAANAADGCYVSVARPCHNALSLHEGLGYVKDSDLLANRNAARCLQRAAEYFNYCNGPRNDQTVVTYFITKGVWVIYAVKNASTSYTAAPASAGRTGVVNLGQ